MLILGASYIVLGLVCRLEESAQGLEEPHDLGFAEDVRKDLEVGAETRETVEVEQPRLLVSVVKVIRHHRSVNAAEEVHYVLVLEYLHQLDDLTLRVIPFLRHLYLVVKHHQVLLDQFQQRGGWSPIEPLLRVVIIEDTLKTNVSVVV